MPDNIRTFPLSTPALRSLTLPLHAQLAPPSTSSAPVKTTSTPSSSSPSPTPSSTSRRLHRPHHHTNGLKLNALGAASITGNKQGAAVDLAHSDPAHAESTLSILR